MMRSRGQVGPAGQAGLVSQCGIHLSHLPHVSRASHLRHFSAVFVLGFAVGCSSPPQQTFARSVDRAASWAASAEFAIELHAASLVPAAYLHNVLETGAQELVKIQSQIQDADGIAPPIRRETASLCADLRDRLADTSPEVGRLRAIEGRLRATAASIRGGAPRQ